MINFQKLGAITTTGAVLFSLVATPVFADTNLNVTGNGADSHSGVSVMSNSSTTVTQSNSATVTNNVSNHSNTGSNMANENTNGNTSISTGVSNVGIGINNSLNNNAAQVAGTPGMGNTNVNVANNGADSHNQVGVTTTSNNGQAAGIFQTNNAYVANHVTNSQTTGNNTSNENTNGSTGISTGAANSSIQVTTTANQNMASIGMPVSGANSGVGNTNLTISGNGADSHNNIGLSNSQSAIIEQGNSAYVTNNVGVVQNSGNNTANENTGGVVSVSTGASNSTIGLLTSVNNNVAQVGNDWVVGGGLNANINNNGADTHNWVSANTGNTVGIFQGGSVGTGNNANVNNNVSTQGLPGFNTANENTGNNCIGNVSVSTGVSNSSTSITTQGNQNSFMTGNMPWTFGFSWNLFGQ